MLILKLDRELTYFLRHCADLNPSLCRSLLKFTERELPKSDKKDYRDTSRFSDVEDRYWDENSYDEDDDDEDDEDDDDEEDSGEDEEEDGEDA